MTAPITRSITRSITRRAALTLAAASALPATSFAQSTKIVFGFTAVSDFTSIFVAKEEGFFSKRGLDVEPKFIPLNSTIPSAIQADSLQMGGPTPSVFLQSVDGGLDHVVVAGGGLTSKTGTALGVVAKAGSGIKVPADFVGKKVGVPGLGAFLHVTFRAWLKQNGVDYRKVTFIEASFPQHGDLIRGGSIDAVVTGDPFMTRITSSGVGYVASYYATFLPEGQPTIVYAAKRDWAAKNAPAVKQFQLAIQEAAAWMLQPKNSAKMREHIGKYIKVPPEILAVMQVSPPAPIINEKQLTYWVGMMNEQEMLKAVPKVANLIVK